MMTHLRKVVAFTLSATLTACTGSGFSGGQKPIETEPTIGSKPAPKTSAQGKRPGTAGKAGMATQAQKTDDTVPSETEVLNPSQGGVTPSTSKPNAKPSAKPKPAMTETDSAVAHVHLPVTAFVNMENGYHGLDEGYVFQLIEDGKVVVAGLATIEAARNGKATDGQGAYPGILLRLDATFAPNAKSGSGTINVCFADPNVAPEDGKCQEKSGQFGGGDGERPTALIGARASWRLTGGLGLSESPIPELEVDGDFNLGTHHPVWAFAAPGKGFKDFQSPIVLDLDQNGSLDLVDVWNDKEAVRFDLMADGKKLRTGWVKPTDGFLALDLNGNGMIDNGMELFGEYTKGAATVKAGTKSFDNGYQALAQYDANKDGKIDAKDPMFAKLVVWQDKNLDGVTQKGELKSLADTGIAAVSLAYGRTGTRAFKIVANNEVRLVSTYTMKDGHEFQTADVWFKARRFSDAQTANTK